MHTQALASGPRGSHTCCLKPVLIIYTTIPRRGNITLVRAISRVESGPDPWGWAEAIVGPRGQG